MVNLNENCHYSPALKKGGGYIGFGLSVIRQSVRLSVIILSFPLNIFRTLL